MQWWPTGDACSEYIFRGTYTSLRSPSNHLAIRNAQHAIRRGYLASGHSRAEILFPCSLLKTRKKQQCSLRIRTHSQLTGWLSVSTFAHSFPNNKEPIWAATCGLWFVRSRRLQCIINVCVLNCSLSGQIGPTNSFRMGFYISTFSFDDKPPRIGNLFPLAVLHYSLSMFQK